LVILSTPFLQNVVSLSSNVAALWQIAIYGFALVLFVFFRPGGIVPEGVGLGSVARRLDRRPAPEGADANDADDLKAARMPARHVASVAAFEGAGGQSGQAPEPVLVVSGLAKSFGGIHAVDGLDLALAGGQVTALVGPNGAGKTTVFNLLTGFIPPDEGSVRLFGEDVRGLRPDQIAARGMVRSHQDVRLFPAMTVLENVMVGVQDHPGEDFLDVLVRPRLSARRDREARKLALECLKFTGTADLAGERAGALSYGQQKLVALARVMATESPVLLLDEPASGIDRRWVDEMLDLIRRLREDGRTVCIVEHNLHVVSEISDIVYFMELGRCTAQGAFDDLRKEKRLADAYFGTSES
jgi:branched-chain amino acid transport system permease protein